MAERPMGKGKENSQTKGKTMLDHDYPENDADHEYVTTIDGCNIRISKVGGGTVGRAYCGDWHYSIGRDYAVRGSDLYTGTPKSHRQVAELVYEFDGGNGRCVFVSNY